MTDTQLLDWLEEHPDGPIKPGRTKYGKPCWLWGVTSPAHQHYEPAFSLRSAIMAAMAAEKETK